MRLPYFSVLASTAMLGGLAQFPNMLLLGMILLVLPGLLMLASSVIFPYLACFAPVALSSFDPNRRQSAIAATALLLVATAFGPGVIGRAGIERYADTVEPAGPSEPARIAPKSITLTIRGEPGCNSICAKLLLSRSVNAVYLVSQIANQADLNSPSASKRYYVYHLLPVGRCGDAEAATDYAVAKYGACVSEAVMGREEGEVVLTEQVTSGVAGSCRPPPDLKFWTTEGRVLNLEVWERINGDLVPVEQIPQVMGFVPPIPFYVYTGGCGPSEMGLKLAAASVPYIAHPADIESLLVRRYGFDLTPKQFVP
jgi:hypothetical protein